MKYVLKRRVATTDATFRVFPAGAVYVDGQTITAVQDRAAPPPPLRRGNHREYPGIIFPGLIELHNHLSYNAAKPGGSTKSDRGIKKALRPFYPN
jgi:cytosine/adenosine deaminase-related metal-dependent hydrolase